MESTTITWEQAHDPKTFRPKRLAANYQIGTIVSLPIYESRTLTLELAEKLLSKDRQILIKVYHFLSDDHRLALPMRAVLNAVLGEIQLVWYEIRGIAIPPKVMAHQEERMAKAKATTAEQETEQAATKTKEPRVTNRSIIEAGLLAGTPDEEILAQVKERFPNGKADMKHIAYYRHFLVKEGKLEKPPRKERAKKEAVAEEAPAAPPQTRSAQAGSAQRTGGQARSAASASPARTGGSSRSGAKAGR